LGLGRIVEKFGEDGVDGADPTGTTVGAASDSGSTMAADPCQMFGFTIGKTD